MQDSDPIAPTPNDASENRSIYRLRWIGYGLLVFALIDWIQIFLAPRGNAWVLQTIGQLVERMVVPLLGFALLFFGEFFERKPLERILLKILSWLCLLLAVASLLMVPAAIMGAVNIGDQRGQAANQQVEQQLNQLKQLEDRINNSKPEDIKNLATQLSAAGIPVDASDPATLKTRILERINTIRPQLQAQVQTGLANQQREVFKNAIKWSLGALISTVLFFILWKTTDWAR
jgi:uncharacterized membrane protein